MARRNDGPPARASGRRSRREFVLALAAGALGAGMSPVFGGSGEPDRRSARSGRAIWVSPHGDDSSGDGSHVEPLASLQRAIDLAGPGTVIMVLGGVYAPSRVIDVHKGDLTIMAAPGERPVFDAARYPTPDAFNDRVIRLKDVANVTIAGLGFTNGPDGGMEILGEGDNIQVIRCAAFRNGRASREEGQGFGVFGRVSNCVFVECDSYENFDTEGGVGQNADGFQISADGPGNGCHGCRAWNNSDDGFDFFNTSFESGYTIGPVEVSGCQAWRNGYMADGRPSGGDGMGFKLGGQRPGLGNGSGGNTVRGCLSWGNRAIGFTDNHCTIPNRLFDNTARDNGRSNYETQATTELRHNLG
jgi:hypothetical protein